MPGHSDAKGFPAWFAEAAFRMDTTELPETDDLNHPTGPARQAMELAAQAFGAGWTRFITCGATCGILAMVAANCPRGSTVLLQRTCHRSVLSAVALLGLRPVFLPTASSPTRPPTSLTALAPFPPASPDEVALALDRETSIHAVLLTSPDYYGTASDLGRIARIVHAHGALLLVDEAHGAHFAFAPGILPPSAMASGADVAVQSAHKTLPALTQAALLHVSAAALSSGRIDSARLEEALRTFQTSSPSFLVAASLDYARYEMQRHGRQRIESRLRAISDTLGGASGRTGPFLRVIASPRSPLRDPLRIVLDVTGTGLSGFEASRRLSAFGVSSEMADPARIVLIPGLFGHEDAADLASLARALHAVAVDGPAHASPWPLPPDDYGTLISTPAESVLPPGVLFDGLPRDAVLLGDSIGRIVLDPLIPYPPGIPLVWPGERLDERHIRLLEALIGAGGTVSGLSAGSVWCARRDPMV
jgi:arginine decarboxylase